MSSASNTAPTPVVPLNGHCSVVYNLNGVDTLYTFQQDAFQSLPLKPNATWASMPMGAGITGAKCVLGQWNHQDALIIVGGAPVASTPKDYPGLQFYTFSTNAWASVPAGVSVTQNRQMHSAAFLKSSNALLVYSGSQANANTPSSETFTITAEPPYNIQSHGAPGVPLAMNPVLLPWNDTHAVMTGGSAANHAVWLFSMQDEWKTTPVTIPNSIPDMSVVQGAILNGAADGKALQLFNLQAVPNTVTNVLVQTADSAPTQMKRQIDVKSLPAYNASAASSVARTGYSLAQSSSGLVVGSGGTTGNTAASVVLFNQTANGWVTPQSFFSPDTTNSNSNLQSPLSGSSTSTATSSTSTSVGTSSTSTMSSAATTTASAPTSTPTMVAGDSGLSDSGRTILGGVLGGLAGAGALLVLLLLCLRWRKQKKRARAQNFHREKGNQMGFDDSEAVAGFKRSASRASRHSIKEEWPRSPTAQEKLGTTISKPNLIYDSSSPSKITSPGLSQPLISSTLPPTNKTKSDDGWNQYFSKSASSSGGLLAEPSGALRMNSAARGTEYSLSNYDVESRRASIYGDNDTAPLNPRSSGYPQSEESFEQSRLHSRHDRKASSNYRPDSAISEEEPETFLNAPSSSSGTQAWEALGTGDGTSSFGRRPASSMYAESIHFPHPGDKVDISGDGDSSLHTTSAIKGSDASHSRGMRTMVTKDLIGGGSSKPKKDDMSWLNLGAK